ncbi:glycerol dehydratase, cobalamin-independent, small subunit [Cohaesibacter marisflavi]|uniref:Glycerol dehydratase, cobalamin-independent, small subunit n=1 Tax=Cohaesibacter marisflavi TaxID=655353 RepID=A0A1I5FKA5_9HYPH|nr:glycyl-radical enzyme activating protein [Cohaesibacter marisflavi]SFO24063.1 glycerol dehydratase, cobalamin-independent, small subunit [Cohaesibacter marisflavi]
MAPINYDQEGVVFDIQRYSIHDGPGVRTIVFLKGCPLRCRWCSNPESQDPKPELFYKDSSCIHCGKCLPVCPVAALSQDNPGFVDRDKCIRCGACAEACPTDALTRSGKVMTVNQVLQEVRKDATHYRRSGGGITLSGGEPLMQSDFARELLKACHEQGWNTAMETTGFTTPEIIADVMPHVDHALLDIKAIDPAVHMANTGVDNRIILENAIRTAMTSKSVVVRVPVVPGVNDTEQAISDIGNFAKMLPGVETVHLLGYHSYGENKYGLLNRAYPMGDTPDLPKDALPPLKKVIESLGLNCMIGG